MLVHAVLFWSKPNLTAAQVASFRAGLESLRPIPTIQSIYIGTPAGVTDRPVVDKSFSFCLTIVFENVAAHDAYQTHPTHVAFVESCQQYWNRVQIFDAE